MLKKNESEVIKQRAAESGLSLSRYMVQAAVTDEGLTDKKKQQIYLHKVKIQDHAKQILMLEDNEHAGQIYKETEEIW